MPKKIPPPPPSGKDKTITFHRFPHHIWHDQNLSLHERVVLCRVWSFLPRRCYLSYAQWAKELGCHRVTAVELLNKLVSKNKLTKSPAPEGSNEWQLVVSDYHLINEDDVASSPTLLPLVVSDYHPSSPTLPPLVVSDYPRRSLEDHKEDHKEDQAVADAPPLSIESLETLSQESDSLREPIEVSEAPPIPAAPPKAQKPKKPDLTIDAVDALEVPDEVKAAAKRWFEHKQLIKNPIKVRTLLREITKYGLGLPVVVQRSIASNYDGLWPIKYQDLDEIADEAVNKLFVCMSEDGDWVEAGRSNPLLRDSLTEYMGANGIDDKQTFKNKAEGNSRIFILKDIKKIYMRKMKQTLNNL